jgi:hypothetical protein
MIYTEILKKSKDLKSMNWIKAISATSVTLYGIAIMLSVVAVLLDLKDLECKSVTIPMVLTYGVATILAITAVIMCLII